VCFMSIPKPKPAPAPPQKSAGEIAAVNDQRQRSYAASQSGRRSTMLTRLSDEEANMPVARKRLLGE
jgi:hypothetical protein